MTLASLPIVQQVQSAFLANVSAYVGRTPYLSEAGRAEVRTLLERGAGSRPVADALSLGLLEDWASRASRYQSGEKIVARRFGAERLLEPFTNARCYLKEIDREAFLRDLSSLPPSSRSVLEIDYSSPFYSDVTAWLEMSTVGIDHSMNDFGLYFFHQHEDRRVTLRVGSLSVLETGLRHCFGESAAGLCEAPGVVDAAEIHGLHQVALHPYGLPLELNDIHETPKQHPALLGPHDGYHAAVWSSSLQPQFREAATLFYDVLAGTLEGSEWETFQGVCDRLQDLNVSPSYLRDTIRSLPKHLPLPKVSLILDRLTAVIRGRFPRPAQRGQDVSDLLTFIARYRRQELTQIAGPQ